MSRTRTQTNYAGNGTKYNLQDVLLATVQNLGSQDSITDLVAAGDGHDLDITHRTVRGMVIEEVATTGSISGRKWKNWMPDRIRNPSDSLYGHLIVTDKPTDAILAADLLARTNPSRPVVDLPVAIYELREIPDLLKKEGDKLFSARGLATGNLVNQFALKPLISDLTNLLNFSDEVEKRQRELERLHAGGLKRKRELWSGSNSAGPIDIIAQSGDKLTIHMINHKVTQCKISGFVKWFPQDPGFMKSSELRAQARRAVLGLTIDKSTAWNAIPWSWLVDWCSNVGDILIANRNIVGATHGQVQIMTQTTTTCDSTLTGISGAKYSPGGYTETTKRRRSIVHVPVDVQLPVLSFRQLSILGSIGVTRRVPRSL